MKNLSAKQEKKRKIVIFGGSFNPAAKHHRQIAERLTELFDLVMIVPCGPRSDKVSVDGSLLNHRQEMVRLNFSDLPKIQFDFYDLEHGVYTPTYLLHQKYQAQFPDAQIWYAVGGDIIIGGGKKQSEIHRVWHQGEKVWQELNFFIIFRPGYNIHPEDMPPFSELLVIEDIVGTGSMIRHFISEGKPVNNLVLPEVLKYIKQNRLYEK